MRQKKEVAMERTFETFLGLIRRLDSYISSNDTFISQKAGLQSLRLNIRSGVNMIFKLT